MFQKFLGVFVVFLLLVSCVNKKTWDCTKKTSPGDYQTDKTVVDDNCTEVESSKK